MTIYSLTSKELVKIFNALEKAYPILLEQIGFKDGYPEQICGDISRAINDFLKNRLNVPSQLMSGTYKGRGTIFSGGRNGTDHAWIELKVRLKDAYKRPVLRIIIDGAYAQFFPCFTPKVIRDRVRLMVFFDDKTAQRWYKPAASYSRLSR